MSTIKRDFPFLLICLMSSFDGLAQNKTDFIVNEGEVVTKAIPIEEQYRFPEFQPGQVYFRNHTFIRATLNYNLLYGEMQFINHKGDTLSLPGEYKLKLITVGDYTYYHAYKVGYLEVLSSYPQVKLARKQTLELTKSTVDLSSYSVDVSLFIPNQRGVGSVIKGNDWNLRELYTQKAPGDLNLAKKASYFIIDKNERIYPANKNTVMNLFHKHKKEIDAYIKEYQPDFNQRNDLQGLLAYCSQLDSK